jgi:D-serine deaminase-like pyridoxal phosphate-dependent protein
MHHSRVGDALDLLDIPAVQANIACLIQRLRPTGVRVRPHLKTVRSPALTHLLLAAGAMGSSVAKVSEAEVMLPGGSDDLLITAEIVGGPRLMRLVRLREQTLCLNVVVDSQAGARALSRAMSGADLHRIEPLQSTAR